MHHDCIYDIVMYIFRYNAYTKSWYVSAGTLTDTTSGLIRNGLFNVMYAVIKKLTYCFKTKQHSNQIIGQLGKH